MTIYVPDTNAVSAILDQDARVLARFYAALSQDAVILSCPMVWYEIRRGLLAKDARAQMRDFEKLFASFAWQDYVEADWALAATLWAQRRAKGRPISDADLLIAVFTRNRTATLITDNAKDFESLGVTVENWTKDA